MVQSTAGDAAVRAMLPAVALVALLAATAGAQQQVFRAAAEAVTVDVSVRDRNNSVATLTPADFDLRDNGVAQTIVNLSYGQVPIDVRLLVDLSGSIRPDQLKRHDAAIRELQDALSPDDRCEVSTFARRITRLVPLGPPPVTPTFTRPALDGTTFYDAALLAMVTVAQPGRRQLTMLLTDGVDTESFLDDAALLDAAKRTDAVVNVITALNRPLSGPVEQQFKRMTVPTGGQIMTIKPGGDIGPTLAALVADFRQSYVLTYSPAGVPAQGWHDITVTVPNTKYVIRARQGYFGG